MDVNCCLCSLHFSYISRFPLGLLCHRIGATDVEWFPFGYERSKLISITPALRLRLNVVSEQKVPGVVTIMSLRFIKSGFSIAVCLAILQNELCTYSWKRTTAIQSIQYWLNKTIKRVIRIFWWLFRERDENLAPGLDPNIDNLLEVVNDDDDWNFDGFTGGQIAQHVVVKRNLLE